MTWPRHETEVAVTAPAKINWYLYVVGRRPDGYHDIVSLMTPLTLADQVRICYKPTDTKRWLRCPKRPDLEGPHNLALRAVRWWEKHVEPIPGGLDILLTKHVPTGAGLGGGSADAAAVLRSLCRLSGRQSLHLQTLCDLGCDVPFCLASKAALVTGRGEHLSPIERLPELDLCIVWPGFEIHSEWAYSQSRPTRLPDADTDHLSRIGDNDLWTAAVEKYPMLAKVRNDLKKLGAKATGMTGSGSALFGSFESQTAAGQAASRFRDRGFWATRTQTRPVADWSPACSA
ncbi:MAG: 4-(cytidine 5'-diphospho)-2-C-methyl-D-erythritol kinase [Deltaproteobacteria bacterium]|nr:4-(cytidine 5'-diphospho)-2-C-methyl-D-erythritol kinase [Deltaproteobacteria bacterium]